MKPAPNRWAGGTRWCATRRPGRLRGVGVHGGSCGGLPKDLLRRDAAAGPIRLTAAPGARAEYSNVGYALLGDLIEAVSGEPYDEVCRRTVLDPYGLAGVTMQRRGAAPATVTGHRLVAGRVAPAPAAVASSPASGGMTATLDDLLVLAGLFARGDDPLIAAALALTTPAGPGVRFAAGLALLDRPGGTLLWRGGATDGFTTELVVGPGGAGAAVLLANVAPAEQLRTLAVELAGAAPR